MRLLLKYLTTQNQRKLSISLAKQVLTLWLSLSVQATALISLNQNSALVTRRPVALFLLHWHLTCSMLSWLSCQVSQSFFTDHLLFHRSMLTSSTSSVVNCQMLLVFQRSSFARHLRAPFAKSTSTQTLVWLSLPLFVRLWLRNLQSSTHVSIVDQLVTLWRLCTSTRLLTCSVLITN